MDHGGKTVLVCNCGDSMTIDGEVLAKSLGAEEAPMVQSGLCRSQIENFKAALADEKSVIVGCTQEAPFFVETMESMESDKDVRFFNIRERAGWSNQGKSASAKMAALIAEAALDLPPAKQVTMTSTGVLLIIGNDETAIEVASQVEDRLNVTVLLTGSTDVQAPRQMTFPIVKGDVKGASGHLGAFQLEIQNYAPSKPTSRTLLEFEDGGQSGTSVADLILDLRGDTPLFQAAEKRDGYFNPEPGNPALVQKALLELTDLVGEFDKPQYVEYDESLCAHSRNQQVGCTRCLDLCPTGAIQPDGDHVKIDAYVCAGCGACASVCPTGAAGYAQPTNEAAIQRLRTLLTAYRDAKGRDATLLIVDQNHGDALIDMMARFGKGLPANVIPFTVNEVTQVGLDFLLAGIGYGANRMVFVLDPKKLDETEGLKQQLLFATAILQGLGFEGQRFSTFDGQDPDILETQLYGLDNIEDLKAGSFLAMGRKKSLLQLGLQQVHDMAPAPVDMVALPEGAPLGTVNVNVDGCTLCLSCVGACPTGALKDNPETPQLSFVESACVQCGLCRNTCPEKVITLEPRVNFTEAARNTVVIKEEEPFHCVSCGKPYGTKSSINRMIDKLSGHSMFQDETALDRLKMCEDCRVVSMATDESHPFSAGRPPVPKTTDDYLREREELRKQAAADIAAREAAKRDTQGEG